MIQGVNTYNRTEMTMNMTDRTVQEAAKRQAAEEKPAEQGRQEPAMSEEELDKKLTQLKKLMQGHNIEISYNDDVDRYAIKVVNAETKETIREIPTEKMLQMFAKMLEMEGMLVDEKR